MKMMHMPVLTCKFNFFTTYTSYSYASHVSVMWRAATC